jgi:hypothetical protein
MKKVMKVMEVLDADSCLHHLHDLHHLHHLTFSIHVSNDSKNAPRNCRVSALLS